MDTELISDISNDILKRIEEGRKLYYFLTLEANFLNRVCTIFSRVKEDSILVQDEEINTLLTQLNVGEINIETITTIEERIGQLKRKKKIFSFSTKKESLSFSSQKEFEEKEHEVQEEYKKIVEMQKSLESILKSLEDCLEKTKHVNAITEEDVQNIFHDLMNLMLQIGDIEGLMKIYHDTARGIHAEYEKIQKMPKEEEQKATSLLPLKIKEKRVYPSYKKEMTRDIAFTFQEETQNIRSLLQLGQNDLALTLMGDFKNEILIRILYEIEIEKSLLKKEKHLSLEEQQIYEELKQELVEEEKNIREIGKEKTKWQKLK